MPDIQPFLKELISAPGLSGYEGPVAKIITEKWKPLLDELSQSKIGSLHGLRKGSGPAPRLSIMIATHMDAIGLMVTGIAEGGLLRFTDIGGVDPRILPGQPVIVHGRQELPGIVVQPSGRQLPPEIADSPVPMEHLFIDTGQLPRKVKDLIQVGDLASFATEPVSLAGETLAGHTLDNRASVAALTVCLEELQNRSLAWDLWAVATVQEETGLIGATTSTYEIQPSLAIAVDVTFAKGPGASDWDTYLLGKGPTLGWGPNIHPALYKAFKDLADKLEIPTAMEVMPRHSGTDGWVMQVTAEGIPTIVISVPLRYMHTPVELVAIKDIQRVGRLMAEFIAGLTPDYMETIKWEAQP